VIRVGIVDDHPVVLEGLSASLAKVEDIEVAWSVATLAEARVAIGWRTCDAVLVDVRLPDGSGLDLIARTVDGPVFLVLSSFDRPQYARAALQRGASGYLLKTAPTAEVAAALRAAVTGGTSFRADHLRAMVPERDATTRELDVIRLVSAGWSNDEVGTRLGLSPKTIEAYLTRIFGKLNVHSRTELAMHAEREGWLDVDVI